MMDDILLTLYKVTWTGTANSYVVARTQNTDLIKAQVRQNDQRCDDIVSVEKFVLPAFEDDNFRKQEYVHLFMETKIL